MAVNKLRVPCAYQGGKQRIAPQIVDILLRLNINYNTKFYDLCCGSGAISIELINRGIKPSQIIMLDISSWGVFWKAIGNGNFNMGIFDSFLYSLPDDKTLLKKYLNILSKQPIGIHEAELYTILQSCSFGGKQIWRDGDLWRNACFRDYWEPTETSIRRSPANPMQPSPTQLRYRIKSIVNSMKGITCFSIDVMAITDLLLSENTIVYIDPPYHNTTGYAYNFDLQLFIEKFKNKNNVPLFVSESIPLNKEAQSLNLGGSNGGITGSRKIKHQEWLSRF